MSLATFWAAVQMVAYGILWVVGLTFALGCLWMAWGGTTLVINGFPLPWWFRFFYWRFNPWWLGRLPARIVARLYIWRYKRWPPGMLDLMSYSTLHGLSAKAYAEWGPSATSDEKPSSRPEQSSD